MIKENFAKFKEKIRRNRYSYDNAFRAGEQAEKLKSHLYMQELQKRHEKEIEKLHRQEKKLKAYVHDIESKLYEFNEIFAGIGFLNTILEERVDVKFLEVQKEYNQFKIAIDTANSYIRKFYTKFRRSHKSIRKFNVYAKVLNYDGEKKS